MKMWQNIICILFILAFIGCNQNSNKPISTEHMQSFANIDSCIKEIDTDTSKAKKFQQYASLLKNTSLNILDSCKLLIKLNRNDTTSGNQKYSYVKKIIDAENRINTTATGQDLMAKALVYYNHYYYTTNQQKNVKLDLEKYFVYANANTDSLYKPYVLQNLGITYEKLGDTKKAIVTLEECAAWCKKNNRLDEYIRTVKNLIISYSNKKQEAKALTLIEDAIDWKDITDEQKEKLLLEKTKLLHTNNNKIAFLQSTKKNNSADNIQYYCNEYLYEIYIEQQQYAAALQHAFLMQQYSQLENRDKAKIDWSIAKIYFTMQQVDSANYYLDKGLQKVCRTEIKQGNCYPVFSQLSTENTIYDLCLEKANYKIKNATNENIESAIQYLLAAKKVAELNRKELVFDESKYSWGVDLKTVSEKLLQCYYLLYTKTKNPKYAQLAFMVAEENKATALQDNTEQNILANENADSNYAKYIALRKQLNDIEVQQQTVTKNAQQQKLATESNAIIMQLGIYKSLSNATIAGQEKKPSFEELLRYLQTKNCNALSYFVGDEKVYMLFLNAATNQLQFAQCDTSIKDAVQELCNLQHNENIYSTQKNRFVHLSNYVYNNIFGNICKADNKTTTLILPDAVLNNLAFDALLTDTNKMNSFLIKQNKISYAYSIRSALSQAQRGFANGNSILITAPFTNSAVRSLPILQSSNKEVKQISSYLKSKTFTNATASFSNFQQNLAGYQYLHIASHASAGETPKLEFYDSAVLVNSIYQLTMNQSLAYLNTCQSGSGVNYYSEGNLSLGRAFYSNGVHNIVLTLWNMNDASTATISNLFYKNLQQSNNSVTALHSAKLNYLSSQPLDKQAPYYWASLQHIGDGSLDADNKMRSWWKWALGVSLLILIGIIIIKKRKKI